MQDEMSIADLKTLYIEAIIALDLLRVAIERNPTKATKVQTEHLQNYKTSDLPAWATQQAMSVGHSILDSELIALGLSMVQPPVAPIYHEWIDCDWCGGHAPEGIGMMCCPECQCEGTLDNGMSCHICDGDGSIPCPHCNDKED